MYIKLHFIYVLLMVYVPAGDLVLSSLTLTLHLAVSSGSAAPPRRLLEGSSASNGIRRPAATFFSVAGLLLAGAPDGAYFRRCWEWFTDCRAALGYVCIGNCKCTVDSQFGDSGCRLYHYETAVRKVGYDLGTLYGFVEHRE